MAAQTDSVAPVLVSATAQGTALVLTYSEALAGTSVSSTAFSVAVNGSSRLIDRTSVRVSGMRVTLTLVSAVSAGDTVTLNYVAAVAGPSSRIRDLAGNEAADLTNQNVKTDFTAPTVSSATVDGATLTLTYDEALDSGSTPAAGDFMVTVAGSPRAVTTVGVSGRAVTLALASAVTSGQTVTVSYTAGTNPIRDAAGNNAANLTNHAVTNNSTAPTVSSAMVDGATLTLTYDEALAGTAPAAGAFTVTVAGGNRGVNSVALDGRAVTLTLASAVSARQTVTVGYVAANAGGNPIRDAAGNEAADLTSHAVTNNTPDGVAPVLVSATAQGTALVLTYSEALAGTSVSSTAFSVAVNGSSRLIDRTSVRVSGMRVTLTLC